jgi:hypothetical protein
MKTHVAGILQTKPSPHGASRNPQVSIMNPGLKPHFCWTICDCCYTRRVSRVAAVDATHYLKWLTNSEWKKSKRVEGEEKLSGLLRQPDFSDKLQQKKIHLASR